MKTIPTWKIVCASLLDVIGSILILSTIISFVTGGITTRTVNGFHSWNSHLGLGGIIVLIILEVAYFKLSKKYLGGTLGKKIFGIANNYKIIVEREI